MQLTRFIFLAAIFLSFPVLSDQSCNDAGHCLKAPDYVLPGEQIVPLWSGPVANQDVMELWSITIDGERIQRVESFNMGAVDFASQNGTWGFGAPSQSGLYELIYLGQVDDPEQNPFVIIRVLAVGGQAVVAWGSQADSGDMINRDLSAADFGYSGDSITMQDLCDYGPALAPALQPLVGFAMSGAMSAMSQIPGGVASQIQGALPNLPSQGEIGDALGQAYVDICTDPPGSANYFTIAYSFCRMEMHTWMPVENEEGVDFLLLQSMEISMPPGASEAYMNIADHGKQEAMTMALAKSLRDVAYGAAGQGGIGRGFADGISMQQAGTGNIRGYDVTTYNFEYSIRMGGAGANPAMEMIAGMVSAKTSGTAHIAPAAPGNDIAQSFYENLSSVAQPEGGFFSGLITSQAAMLAHGIPIDITSTVSSKVMGATMVQGTSRSAVYDVRLIPFSPDDCSQTIIPAGYTVTDVDQQISDALSGAPGGSGQGGQADEMSQAMGELNKVMEGMTDEQRSALSGLGLDSLIPGMGGAQQPAAAPAGSAAPAATRSGPSSSELTTDNLTQSVQLHLQALGYSVGNTDGNLDTDTIIAISQFQAENGMKPSGEVSPQLLGILGARVDTR